MRLEETFLLTFSNNFLFGHAWYIIYDLFFELKRMEFNFKEHLVLFLILLHLCQIAIVSWNNKDLAWWSQSCEDSSASLGLLQPANTSSNYGTSTILFISEFLFRLELSAMMFSIIISSHFMVIWKGSLSLIHIWRCRRYAVCRSRWSPYH